MGLVESSGGDVFYQQYYSGNLLSLQRLYVGSLPALRSFNYVELDGLALLKAFKATGADSRVVYENIFTVLARDEPEALCVIEPLYCSLFHCC
jgi:hypothetical protein